LTGHAVDLVAYDDGQISWHWPLYDKIADAMFKAAKELNIDIVWGGHWQTLRDGPHFELSWHSYPKEEKIT
jgi:peptidoglycan L-alanyl-D-glutamate endopeptidase CwlK